tara:strand:- start:1851 stop:2600 length:750 start_codon:yes stop_codon:yes gene_type:complete
MVNKKMKAQELSKNTCILLVLLRKRMQTLEDANGIKAFTWTSEYLDGQYVTIASSITKETFKTTLWSFIYNCFYQIATKTNSTTWKGSDYYKNYSDISKEWVKGVHVFDKTWLKLVFPEFDKTGIISQRKNKLNLYSGALITSEEMFVYRAEKGTYGPIGANKIELQEDRPAMAVSLISTCASTFQANLQVYKLMKNVKFFPVFIFNPMECELVLLQTHITYRKGTPEDPHIVFPFLMQERLRSEPPSL